MRQSRFVPFRLVPTFLVILPMTLGCGATDATPKPTTYPVTGTVRYKSGEPIKGGLIQFLPQGPQAETTTAEIKPDGTFSLLTRLASGEPLPGAVEGQYKITVILPS